MVEATQQDTDRKFYGSQGTPPRGLTLEQSTSLSGGRLILPERLGNGLSGTGGLLVSESVSLAEDCDRSGTAMGAAVAQWLRYPTMAGMS
ncbi:hypothetical protein TNCV_149701 [Trichonephila clavipes]|nr:hypothetical protein TNCV_149701 [Trichonephila clavipes]